MIYSKNSLYKPRAVIIKETRIGFLPILKK